MLLMMCCFVDTTPAEESKKVTEEAEPQKAVKHLYTAKLLLRRLDSVSMTPEQLEAFNQLSFDLRKRIDKNRAEVGITKETIKRRDKVYSELKKSKLKGDEFWNTLQEKADLSAAQRDVFRDTLVHFKKFRADALKLLTEEQRARIPKGKLPAK